MPGMTETPAATENLTPAEIWHYYATFVEVPARANCPHGEGTTYLDAATGGHGVRIACPEGRDCWFVYWKFAA